MRKVRHSLHIDLKCPVPKKRRRAAAPALIRAGFTCTKAEPNLNECLLSFVGHPPATGHFQPAAVKLLAISFLHVWATESTIHNVVPGDRADTLRSDQGAPFEVRDFRVSLTSSVFT